MAFVEQRGKRHRIIFRFAGRRYTHTLNTTNRKDADALKGGIERTLMLLEQKVLHVPDGVDIVTYVLSNGAIKTPECGQRSEAPEPVTFQQLRQRYLDTHANGAMEANSLATAAMHLRHIEKSLGARFAMQTLTLAHLQQHVDRRARQRGLRKRP
jgi:hypothetical protein